MTQSLRLTGPSSAPDVPPHATARLRHHWRTPERSRCGGHATVRKGEIDPGLFGFSPERRILLVTCTGPVDPERGLRSQNLLVLASIAPTPGVVDG